MTGRDIRDVATLLSLMVAATACAETHEPSCEVEPTACIPTDDPCHEGTWECTAAGEIVCVAHEPLPTGAPCDVGLACDDSGSCSVCTPSIACDTGEPCVSGSIDCASGEPVCVAEPGPIDCPPREPCGATCDTGDPCMAGTFDCTMGEPVCVAVRMMPEGTPCGPGVACDPEGGCDICLEGATCDSGDPCTRGAVACVADEPICIVADVLPEGTPCGASGLCDATATCSECVSGSACRLSDGCVVGAVECATGEAICAPIENLPAGTPCGAFGTCDGAGLCIEA